MQKDYCGAILHLPKVSSYDLRRCLLESSAPCVIIHASWRSFPLTLSAASAFRPFSCLVPLTLFSAYHRPGNAAFAEDLEGVLQIASRYDRKRAHTAVSRIVRPSNAYCSPTSHSDPATHPDTPWPCSDPDPRVGLRMTDAAVSSLNEIPLHATDFIASAPEWASLRLAWFFAASDALQ